MNSKNGAGGTSSRHPDWSMGMVLLGLGLLLCGCEAALDLSAVEAQSARPVQRADLFQAAARHLDQVIVVGGMGTVVHSMDRGSSWQRSNLPGGPFLVDVTTCPDGVFHAIEKTDGIWSMPGDGTWIRQALPEMTEPQALTCDANNVLWVVGGFSTILNSRDAGANWETWSLDEDLYLTTIQFVDGMHGFATGEFGTVLVSGDGGGDWQRASDLPEAFYPQAAYFTSAEEGWVVGLNGTIWHTTDGGGNWEPAASGVSTPLYGITGGEEALVAIGDNTTILVREPAGPDWRALDVRMRSLTYLRGVADIGDGQFVVAGGGTLFTFAARESAAADEPVR